MLVHGQNLVVRRFSGWLEFEAMYDTLSLTNYLYHGGVSAIGQLWVQEEFKYSLFIACILVSSY